MSEIESGRVWHVEEDGSPIGPFDKNFIVKGLASGRFTPDTLVHGPRMLKWEPLRWVPEFRMYFGEDVAPRAVPRPTFHRGQLAHEIDFEVVGEEMQFVEIELDPGEAVVAEAGGMMYMDHAIKMETVFGDGSERKGVFDKLVGAGKRLITGESLFMTIFTNEGRGKAVVSFAAPYPGKIIPLNLAELGGHMICQKSAFLCAAKGVSVGIAFQKRIGVGLFGGEGFIMQSLEGDGLTFVHGGGTIVSRQLAAGERLRVDSGCLVALEPSVDYDIAYVGSVKSALFGGEGLFLADLKGPGTVWLQSLPFSRLAGRVVAHAPQLGGARKGEGSVLGGLGGLDNFLSGD